MKNSKILINQSGFEYYDKLPDGYRIGKLTFISLWMKITFAS